jgi:predicted permease
VIDLAGAQIPRAWEIGFDWRVFVFQAAVCLITGIAFGLAPAFAGSRPTAREALHERDPASRIRGRARDVLIVAEVALAFVLLAGAGLLLRTFLALQGVSAGFDPTHVLTVHIVVQDAGESRAVEERVARIPGIRSTGFISLLPLQNSNWYGRFAVTGRQTEGSAEFRYVTPTYFETMGIPIVRGRALSDRDTAAAPKVLLVNEALARQYFPGENPVGQVLTGRGTIVGVTGDVRQNRLDRPAAAELYYPIAQNFAQLRSVGSTLVIRSGLPVESVAGAVRAAVREVNPNLAAFRVLTMEDVVDESIANHRLYVWLLGVFAGLGLLLAAAGIYGLIAYLVTLRTREFGIRMALGADATKVLRLVMGRGAALVAIGLSIGIVAAIAATRVLNTLLYEVSATDVWTYGGMALLLVAVALTACVVPAVRATRVNPAIALRMDL